MKTPLRPPSSSPRWLLLSDLHFKHSDLDRISRTASWIASLPRDPRVGPIQRAVVCGDLLTSRSMQPTHVLSTCYRFLGALSDAVPHVNVLLGNHDLAALSVRFSAASSDAGASEGHVDGGQGARLRASALDVIRDVRRLAPYVTLHWNISREVWDGRHVLVLPYREDQNELTAAVAALKDDAEAAETVAFGHLAIHRAITQKYVVRAQNFSAGAPGAGDGNDVPAVVAAAAEAFLGDSVTYRGLTGPGYFARLARTFTGHFHNHQTIKQKQLPSDLAASNSASQDPLKGSITYIGSPLQLTWADLLDEQRGVVLLDPVTLEHEFVVNPHAVGYTTAEVRQVLDGTVDSDTVAAKHVMLLGDLTRFKYASARDKLLSMGARSVRTWNPTLPLMQSPGPRVASGGLGAGVPKSDAQLHQQLDEDREKEDMINGHDVSGKEDAQTRPDSPMSDTSPPPQQLDLAGLIREYVDAVELDPSLSCRRDTIVSVGQRLVQASDQISEEGATDENGQPSLHYQTILDPTAPLRSASSASSLSTTSPIFFAQPRFLTVTNFLGVRCTLRLSFRHDILPGVTFIVGDNGSGKSTLVEAVVWCQFGRCIRSGLGANEVVNDVAGRDCSVRLEFENGYTITRYRKHREFGSQVVVTREDDKRKTGAEAEQRGGNMSSPAGSQDPAPLFEGADMRTAQAAINELLGIDYDTFVRTVVLGHESAASFLSSTPTQRRELIEGTLGLSALDEYADVARMMLREVDGEVAELKSKLLGSRQMLQYAQNRVQELRRKKDVLIQEAGRAERKNEVLKEAADRQESMSFEEWLEERGKGDWWSGRGFEQVGKTLEAAEQAAADGQREVERLLVLVKSAELRIAVDGEKAAADYQVRLARQQLEQLAGAREQRVQEQELLLRKQKQDEEEATLRARTFSQRLGQWAIDTLERFNRGVNGMGIGIGKGQGISTLRNRVEHEVLRVVSLAGAFLHSFLLRHSTPPTPIRLPPSPELVSIHQTISSLGARIAATRNDVQALEPRSALPSVISRIASARSVPAEAVTSALSSMTPSAAHAALASLRQAMQQHGALQCARDRALSRRREAVTRRRQAEEAWRARREQTRQEYEAGRRALTGKRHELRMCEGLLGEEAVALTGLQERNEKLEGEVKDRAEDLEMFAFWAGAMGRSGKKAIPTGTGNPIAPSSSGDGGDGGNAADGAKAGVSRKTTAKGSRRSADRERANFREFVVDRNLDELNGLMAQIMTVLYEDTRHARGLTTGMLKSLFISGPPLAPSDSDQDDDATTTTTRGAEKETRVEAAEDLGVRESGSGSSGPVLDKTLNISSAFAYSKRSGGERKRMDLALFFALLHMGHSRSSHRARYMLVDEVFDSLDAAGQDAVVRWCDYMAGRIGHIFVITHSEHLVKRGRGEDGDRDRDEDGAGAERARGRYAVVAAKMGLDGTELEVDGQRIGRAGAEKA